MRTIDHWIVVPTSSILPGWKPQVAGSDMYDHTLIVVDDEGPVLTLPCLNVNPSTRVNSPALGHGVYAVYTGWHKWGTPGQTPGFLIMWPTRELLLGQIPWRVAHGSSLRNNLPGMGKQSVSLINFHRGGLGIGSWDFSEGCFTAPREWFDPLRESYEVGDVNIMAFSDTVEHATASLKREMEPLVGSYSPRSKLRGERE